MTILETLNKKIDELKENSPEEIEKTSNLLKVVNDSIIALDNEELLIDFDFSIAINLVNSHSYGIIDLNKCIKDIKNTLIAKYRYRQSFLTLSNEQHQVIKSFKERLGYLKEEFEDRVNKQSNITIDENILENLDDLKKLLEGKGRRKYYTYEMLEALFEVYNYDDFSYQDMEQLVKELEISKNIKGKLQDEKVDFDEVKKLFTKYLDEKVVGLLEKYQNEICYRINIDNARKIFEFFDRENILNRFSIVSILQIVLYGRFDYIKDFYYERVLPKHDNVKKIYFDDAMSCVWINENESSRNRKNHFIRRNNKDTRKTLYSTIHEVCDDDVWENIRLIKENESILSYKYDLANLDYLWVITKPVWLIKKNIELFKTFGLDDIKLTALCQTDLEDKIHLVIELGLLNSPRTSYFRELEKKVPKYGEFVLNGRKKKLGNCSILNYYPRNTSEIGKTPYYEYIYWFYKMQRSGKENFYKDFFSSFMAGKRNKTDFYGKEEQEILSDNVVIDRIIDENFVINYYDSLIPNYDLYNSVIKEYSTSINGDRIIPYYDKSILNEDGIELLEKHMVTNVYSIDLDIQRVPNEYIYLFDKCIISRYKVLRNLSILKSKFGYIDENMILTSVVHNSYIDRETFDYIKDEIMKGRLVK